MGARGRVALFLRGSGWGFFSGLEFGGGVLAVFRVVVVSDHPIFIVCYWLGDHLAVVVRVGEILDVGFEIAGEVGSGFSEDGEKNCQLLIGLLPFGGVGLEAEGGFELFGAVEGEVDAAGFAVFEEIGAAFALGFLGVAIVVEGGLIFAEDMDARGDSRRDFCFRRGGRWE